MTLTFMVRPTLTPVDVRSDQRKRWDGFTALLWIQGLYYLFTGLWPLVSMDTFIRVTGPKTDNLLTGLLYDHWLVMTVGVLVTAIGLALVVAAWRHSRAPEAAVLAISSALGLTAIDVVYVWREVIPPIYLGDAAGEVILLVAWAVMLRRVAKIREEDESFGNQKRAA
jgi:hypothetical protein